MTNTESSIRKIIIIGATSGIGEALAKQYLAQGDIVGISGRREENLQQLQQAYSSDQLFIQTMDVCQTDEAVSQLKQLVEKMDGVDLVVINAGIGFINKRLSWSLEAETIQTNVVGFAALANYAMNYFLTRGKGQLVSISSISALRGSDLAPAYAASKAFVSNYMEGLRKKASKNKTEIVVTDIQPGFVDTPMAKGDGLFWVCPVDKAAQQIKTAIDKKRQHAYVSKRWRLIAWVMKLLPQPLYHRI